MPQLDRQHEAAKQVQLQNAARPRNGRAVDLKVKDIGEAFVHLEWKRNAAAEESGPATAADEVDLKYEVVLGCTDSGEDRVLHKQVIGTSYRIAQLTPNSTYSVAVRACDASEVWGLWTIKYFRTLSSVGLWCHEIGEDYARVVWHREAAGHVSKRPTDVISADNFVSQYRLLIFSADRTGEGETTAQKPSLEDGNVTDECISPPVAAQSGFKREIMLDATHTSQRIPDLVPERLYGVTVCAQTSSGVWGLWSQPQYFMTVAPFSIPVTDLSIGENYVHFTWGRIDRTAQGSSDGFAAGDHTVTSQQLRIRGLDDGYATDRTLEPRERDLKVYGLKPATAYSIRIRSCNTSGEWGTWSEEICFQTRATIVARVVEISESYIVVRWERKASGERDGRGYPSGRGFITRYHLRVTGLKDFSADAELVEADQPYKISGLSPTTNYRVVIKANYNDDEWGLWSRPLECLTLKKIEIKTTLIGEEFAAIKWSRPEQSRSMEKDGGEEDDVIHCFGARRPVYQLRVTTAESSSGVASHNQLTWAGVGLMDGGAGEEEEEEESEDDDSPGKEGEGKRRKKAAVVERDDDDDPLLAAMKDHKVVMETTLTDLNNEVPFSIAGLKPDTNYNIIVRSRIADGDWGVWSRVQQLVTLKPNVISFVAIGEDYSRITWERPPQIIADPRVARGRGVITKSQLKVKSPTGQVQTYDIDSTVTQFTAEDLQPASTYYVSVRTFNDNHDWGLWSHDRQFRTIAGMHVEVPTIGEDYFRLVFARKADGAKDSPHCVVSVDTSVSRYQIKLSGDDGFSFLRELPGEAPRSFSLQGFSPQCVYDVAVRGLSRHNVWGQWASQQFMTRSRLELNFGNIGEQFAVVAWDRPGSSSFAASGGRTLLPENEVSRFRLRIEEVLNPATARLFDLAPGISNFKVPELTPNTEYRVWVSSQDLQGRWGLWSAEARMQTLPPLLLDIKDIGEAYSCVAWQREGPAEPQHQEPPPVGGDGHVVVRQGKGDVKQFHVRVEARHGLVVERFLSPDASDCKLEGLQADTIYRVTVRVQDSEGEWGLWAPVRRFITLRPVELSVQKVGEDFIHLDWGRRAEGQHRASIAASQATHEEGWVAGSGHGEEGEEYEEDEEKEEERDESDEEGEGIAEEVSPEADWVDDGELVVGNCEVQKWLIRLCLLPSGGREPGTDPDSTPPEDRSEVELPASEISKRFSQLEPCTCYGISVRALSASGEWGFWSEEEILSTLPLVETQISYIGEDFMVCTWSRPRNSTLPTRLTVFPAENAVHNYQLKISPVGGEDQAGEREFDVSQPKYEVWDMMPGTRYIVRVRERDTDGLWGMWSKTKLLQTLDPMKMNIVDLGECFSLVSWMRAPNAHPEADEVVVSEAKQTLCQVSVDLMEVDGEGNWVPHDSFRLQRSFRPPDDQWRVDSLIPNHVYSVRARCQTDNEYWGGWSVSLLFVTTKPITTTVELINEDNALVSWRRAPADWMQSPSSSISSAPFSSEAQSTGYPQPAPEEPQPETGGESPAVAALDTTTGGGSEGAATASQGGAAPAPGDTKPPWVRGSEQPAFPAKVEGILLGNYEVTEYEVKIEGLGTDAEFTVQLPPHTPSHRITGLLPNRMYSVAVRSKNSMGVWSLWSQRTSLLTLNSMRVTVGKCTEGFACVSWCRDPQNRGDYTSLLQELHAKQEQETKQRLEEKASQREQRAERIDEHDHDEDHLADSGSGRRDSAAHGDSELDEAPMSFLDGTAEVLGEWRHLHIQNLQIQRGSCSAYHLRLWGDDGCPLGATPDERLPPDDRFVLAAEERKRRREQKALAQAQRRKEGGKGGQRVGSPGARGRGVVKKGKKGAAGTSPQKGLGGKAEQAAEEPAEEADAGDGEVVEADGVEEEMEEMDRCVFDAQLVAARNTFRFEMLAPDTQYQVSVRARNVDGEWGLWCQRIEFESLSPLRLEHSGFGEHYINLFWYRSTRQELAEERDRDALCRAYDETIRQKEEQLRVQRAAAEAEMRVWTKPELTAQEQVQERESRAAQKARLKEAKQKLEQRREGMASVASSSETVVERFMLRVILEDGSIEDRVLPASDDEGAPIRNLYTVANLSPNHFYVVLLACGYAGDDWGEWSSPIKFMTQNLIQLSISYVGESFIQLDWKRAPNKRVKGEEMREIQTSRTEQGLGHQYQIMVQHETRQRGLMATRDDKGGDPGEQYIDVVDQNNFRVPGLISDMKYSLAVREWDPKGEWGLWSAQRCCLTLSRMMVAVRDIGEHWIDFAWERQSPRIKYDDPGMVTVPVSVTAYYLNIEELDDNDLPEDEERRRKRLQEEEAKAKAEEEAREAGEETGSKHSSDAGSEDDDRMAMHRRRQKRKEEEDRQQLALLEQAVAESQLGSRGADGRYRVTKKLDPQNASLRIDDLKSDRFYNIRVQAETSGRELGVWSPDTFFVTMRQISVIVDAVNEDSFQLSWQRLQTRRHPRVKNTVHEGDLGVSEYELQVSGRGEDNFHEVSRTFAPSETVFRVSGLGMDQVYAFAVRSRDMKGRLSLWSPPRELVTLRRLRVYPAKVTEQMTVVQWGRDPQSEKQYPQRSTEVPLLVSQDRTLQYHLRVWSADDRSHPLVDKTFIGSINRYAVNYLTPNTSYIVESRACNAAGEWGAWSQKVEVYTMKLVHCEISAVGEDHVKVKWWRDIPDLRQQDQAEIAEIQRGGEAPIPPPPAEIIPGGTVFSTRETRIDKYQVQISILGGPDWDWSTEVPNVDGKTSTFKICDLQPDKRYQVQVRACYEDDEWGTWSQQIATATLNVISVQSVQAGENYAVAQWHRMEHSYQPQWGDPELHLGTLQETLRWHYRVVDCSDVGVPSIGSAGPGGRRASARSTGTGSSKPPIAAVEGAPVSTPVFVCEGFTTAEQVTIEELTPNRRYRILVRHWFNPIESQLPKLTDVPEGEGEAPKEDVPKEGTPQEEGKEEKKEETTGEPGVWGEPSHVATLKPMVVMVEEIAEDFFSLRWDRDPAARTFPPRSVAKLTPEIQSYHVKIDQLLPSGLDTDPGEDALHIDHEFPADETAFRVTKLVPDTVYKVIVRAKADGRWGLWSESCVLITLPKLAITVNNIGEDYAVLSWGRQQRQLEHIQALVGSSANVSRYHVEMFAVDGPFHADKKFKASRTSYKVKRLDPNSLYTVRVRSCDAGNVWSLWSEKSVFVTMKPIRVTFGRVAEQFVHVQWSRDDQNADEYNHEPAPQIPNTTTTKHHLCVFAAEHAPTSALVDKQFGGDVHTYRVSNLNPNSMYIVIVRAANSEMQWGLWSEERTVLTLQLLSVRLACIGENYISVGWQRDEQVHAAALQTAVITQPTQWHIVVTGQDLQYDQQITPADVPDAAAPNFTVRGLRPDTKYILTLRACYEEDEWGLWTNPVTFLTLNQLGLTVSNISEERADFTWGRGAQSAQHTVDPNLVVWKGIITKYSLVIRKNPDAVVPGTDDVVGLDDGTGRIAALAAAGAGAGGAGDEFCVEREMEMNRYKYIQTYCTVDDLTVNTEYTVKVRAQDEKTEWGEWTELMFETPPLAPGKPILNKAHSNFVAFSWDPPDPYNRYLYCVEQATTRDNRTGKVKDGAPGDGGLDWRVVDTVSDTMAKVKSTTAISKLRFRVKCCKMDKPVHLWSRYSPIAAFTTAAAPEAVTNLIVTSLSKNSATLEWTRPAPPSAQAGRQPAAPPRVTYKVHLGEKDGASQLVGTTKQARYELTDLKSNTHYRVQVQVETELGLSARNTVLKFSTRADTAGDRGRTGSVSDMTPRPPQGSDRKANTAPAGRDQVQSATESSDTGDRVKLPAISPPRTAPGRAAAPPTAGPPRQPQPPQQPRPPGEPASGSAHRPPPQGGRAPRRPGDTPEGGARPPRRPQQPQQGGKRPLTSESGGSNTAAGVLGSGFEQLPAVYSQGSDMRTSPPRGQRRQGDSKSNHSDEEYDIVSFQQSDDSGEKGPDDE
eukprot:Hpha_TRINITY_DN15540_c1_g11::TRINITY_DN15540_c1_g11_i1::g.104301::m.104301